MSTFGFIAAGAFVCNGDRVLLYASWHAVMNEQHRLTHDDVFSKSTAEIAMEKRTRSFVGVFGAFSRDEHNCAVN